MGRNFTPEVLQALDAPFRNGLAPRGGLAFDGTASTRVYSTLTNQNVGTDAVSLVATFRVPTTAPNDTEVLSISASALGTQFGSSFSISLYGSGAIGILAVNAGATASRSYTVAGFISAYAGKVVTVTAARSANTVLLYINGVAQAGTDTGSGTGVNWSDSITSTYLIAGFRSSSTLYNGTIYAATLYNCALAQADVTEIYESGGAVPERFKFGAQNINSQAGILWTNSNMTTMTSTSSTGATGTQSSGQGNITAAFDSAGGRVAKIGQQFRVRVSSANNGLAAPQVVLKGFAFSTVSGATTLSEGANDLTVQATAAGDYRFEIRVTAAANFTLTGLQITPLGAVVHLDGESDGIGYQWHDQSTNKLDAVLTATGVSWTKPKLTPTYFRGFTATAGNEQVALTAFVRGPARIMAIYARASGAATVTVGLFSAAAELVASVALNVGVEYQKLTIKSGAASFYNGDGVCTNTGLSIWVNSTTANRIDWYVTWEPINP